MNEVLLIRRKNGIQWEVGFRKVHEKFNGFSRVGVKVADFLGVIGFSGGQGKILRIFLNLTIKL